MNQNILILQIENMEYILYKSKVIDTGCLRVLIRRRHYSTYFSLLNIPSLLIDHNIIM